MEAEQTDRFYSENLGGHMEMHVQTLTHLHPGTQTAICTHPHIAVCTPTHPNTYKDTCSRWYTHELGLVTILFGMHPHHPSLAQSLHHNSSSLSVTSSLSLVYQSLS